MHCPNCGGANPQRLDKGALIVGKRLCRACGCLWEPPWSRFTIWSGLVIMLLGVAAGAWLSCIQVPAILSGEAFRQIGTETSLKRALEHVIGPVILAGALYGLYVCVSVVRGKKGAGYVLRKST